mgnify:CR=1 FL=1
MEQNCIENIDWSGTWVKRPFSHPERKIRIATSCSGIGAPEEAGEEDVPAVAMEDIEIYQIPDQMTIGLAKGVDGKSHYCLMSVSLSINMKDPDYEKYNETLKTQEDIIKDLIFKTVGSHPIEEVDGNQETLRQEILEAIQKQYNSKFIYNVVFRDIMFN